MHPGPIRDILTLGGGIFSGVLSGVFGVGGTVISTPVIRVLGASALASVGTTLPSVIPGAASGTIRYHHEQLIDWHLVATVAPTGIVAAIAGSLLTDHVPGHGHPLMLATAVLLAFSAWRMARPPKRPAHQSAGGTGVAESGPPPTSLQPVGRWRLISVGLVAGLLSGLLGIGGGVILVPGLHQVARRTLKQAVATSLACVGIFAVPGTLTHGLLHQIDWGFALLLSVGIVPGARIGANLAIRAADRRLRQAISVFLGVVAVIFATGEVLAWIH